MGSPNKRLTRVNELLRREIASILLTKMAGILSDPVAVTVTHVLVSPDLRHARVMISILGHEKEQKKFLSELNQHRHEIQQEMNKKVRLKYLPRLHFHIDESLKKGDQVLGLLYNLEQENQDHSE